VTAGEPETQVSEVRLPGHVLPVLAQATPIDPAAVRGAAAEPLQSTIVLNRTDPTGFSALVRAINDPGSPTYRQFVSQAELSRRFEPSQGAYDAVLAWLLQQGFDLVAGSDNRLTITVLGTREQANRAFQAAIRDYTLGGAPSM
jgi:subtilase family serine protease